MWWWRQRRSPDITLQIQIDMAGHPKWYYDLCCHKSLKSYKSWSPKWYRFSKNIAATSKYSCQKGDMIQVPYSGPTNIRCHCTEFSCHGNLLPGICAALIEELIIWISSTTLTSPKCLSFLIWPTSHSIYYTYLIFEKCLVWYFFLLFRLLKSFFQVPAIWQKETFHKFRKPTVWLQELSGWWLVIFWVSPYVHQNNLHHYVLDSVTVHS